MSAIAKTSDELGCRAYRVKETFNYFASMFTPSKDHGPKIPIADRLYGVFGGKDVRNHILKPQPTVTRRKRLDVTELLTVPLIHRFAFYSSLTYCDYQEYAQELDWVMVGKEEPVPLPSFSFKITHWHDEKGVLHYVAVNPRQRLIVLVFRGSGTIKNYLQSGYTSWMSPNPKLYTLSEETKKAERRAIMENKLMILDKAKQKAALNDEVPPPPQGAKQFFGYNLAASRQTRIGVEKLYEQHLRHPFYSVVITGHSLGGAVAHMAATYARMQYRHRLPLDAVYTYGRPIYSNGVFADWADTVIKPTPIIHVTSEKDIVTSLWYEGKSKHPEYQMRPGNGTIEVYSKTTENGRMVVCQGHDDPRCSTGQPCRGDSWDSHLMYGGMRITGSVCKLGTYYYTGGLMF